MTWLDYLRSPVHRQIISNHFLDRRWFVVALGVGFILNLINQYDAIFGEKHISTPKLALTFLVPYLVSSISAWQARAPFKAPLKSRAAHQRLADLTSGQA